MIEKVIIVYFGSKICKLLVLSSQTLVLKSPLYCALGSSDFLLFLDFDYTSYRFEKLSKL
jgi:hypothetical protein